MARVVVVGAGIGGLAAAARLRIKGHEVTVVEQSDSTGGKAGSYRRDGFVFDTGPSLLTLPAVYRDLFLKTGKALEETVDLQPVDPGFRYTWADGATVTVPGVNPAAAAKTLQDVFGGTTRDDWNALMARAGKIWQLTRRPFLESQPSGYRDLLNLAKNLDDVRTVAPAKSLHKLGKQHLHDPRLRMLLDRYATYAGSDPRKAPAALVTIPYIEQTFGAWHIGGGMHKLAEALTERCLERKATFRLGTTVEAIELANDRVTGVRCESGEVVPADIVVSNLDAKVLYQQLLDSPLARAEARKLARATPSFSGFVILAAVRGRTPGIAHHNVWFPSDYRREFADVFGGRPCEDPAIYACVPDDPLMRPDDEHESWFILVNAPRSGEGRKEFDWSDRAFAQGYAQRILGALARRGTDLRERILWHEVITPADLESRTGSPGGSIYGTSSNGMRAAFLRPANTSPISGLYLVGGSAHPGGGLPLVGMSAEIVAETIGRAKRGRTA